MIMLMMSVIEYEFPDLMKVALMVIVIMVVVMVILMV